MKRIYAVISAIIIVAFVGALFWYSPTIISYFQNSFSNSDASYTKLMLRDPIGRVASPNGTVEFGDTEYHFGYAGGIISIFVPPFQHDFIRSPEIGRSYKTLGVEVKVANVSSDYISNFVVIMVKPTVTNYLFTTYRYTKVDIPIGDERTVDISSGLINETNRFTFAYTSAATSFNWGATLIVTTSSQSNQYITYAGLVISEAKNDFKIEILVYQSDSNRMVIYVKPLY